MSKLNRLFFIFSFLCLSLQTQTFAQNYESANSEFIFMKFQRIGNPTYGNVAYPFDISTYEVTNYQYAVFLSSIATVSDPNELYDLKMQNTAQGGIIRQINPTTHIRSYSIKPNMANKPVTFVSWCSAARFANWLHNKMPIGTQNSKTTENGPYTLEPGCASYITTYRKSSAQFFLPTKAEYTKAGQYNYGTRSFTPYATNSGAWPEPLLSDFKGDAINPGPNKMNIEKQFNWNGTSFGNLMSVGSAGPLSRSYYGTYDQMGNAAEWTEEIKLEGDCGGRFYYGGSFKATTAGQIDKGGKISYIHGVSLGYGPVVCPPGIIHDSSGFRNDDVGFRIAKSINATLPGITIEDLSSNNIVEGTQLNR